MTRRIRLVCLLTMPVVLACLVWAAGASAIVLQLPGLTVGYQPPLGQGAAQTKRASAEAKQLKYEGGPVMTSNTNYPLYWAPGGEPAYPAGYISGIDRWFTDLAHDSGNLLNTDSILTQYGDKEGGFANYNSHFGGPLIDSDPYPANGCKAAAICLSDEQLRAEIRTYAEGHGLPGDLAHEYFVVTPPGVTICFEGSGHQCSEGAENVKNFKFCAYHSIFNVGATKYVYADQPYDETSACVAQSPNEGPSDNAISGGLAHEHSESLTNPELTNGWINEKGDEVADICRSANPEKELGSPLGTAPDGAPYNQLINGHEYLYQQMWSNERGACVQRVALPPTLKKLSPKKGPTTGKTRVTIVGSGFVGPVSVLLRRHSRDGSQIDGHDPAHGAHAAGKRGRSVRHRAHRSRRDRGLQKDRLQIQGDQSQKIGREPPDREAAPRARASAPGNGVPGWSLRARERRLGLGVLRAGNESARSQPPTDSAPWGQDSEAGGRAISGFPRDLKLCVPASRRVCLCQFGMSVLPLEYAPSGRGRQANSTFVRAEAAAASWWWRSVRSPGLPAHALGASLAGLSRTGARTAL